MGILISLLNRKSELSVRNGVLLYKQLILPMMVYACPAWPFNACTHIWSLQVLQSKGLRLKTGSPSYRQIQEDLGVYDAKLGHGMHSFNPGAAASPKLLEKVAYPKFAIQPVWAQNPDIQLCKVYPSHKYASAT